MDVTPASLLERLRRPAATEAWGRFVELYTPLLYSWARRMGLQQHDAADLVQDVFTVLVKKLPEFIYDPRHSFRAWLKAVTLNKWREHQRRPAAREQIAGEQTLAELAAPEDLNQFWEIDYRRHLAARALHLMQAEFQPSTWKACWECAVNGRPAAEVAVELGMSAGAVRAAKFRVLCRLRRELEGLA